MRSESEILAMLLGEAERDERIRAVYMNGSRVNPNAAKDILRDYDVVFVVTELAPYLDVGWTARFGRMLLLQEPDRMDVLVGQAHDFTQRYAYLMQLADGVRIDLGLELASETLKAYHTDSLTLPLLDKDGLLPPIPPPSEQSYYPAAPTHALFDRCCNEVWWVAPYVAKALWRGQVLHALACLDCVRSEAMDMVGWYAAMGQGFRVNLGKGRDRLHEWLTPEEWNQVLATHPPARETAIWDALDCLFDLFEHCSTAVAAHMRFTQNTQEAANGRAFVHALRVLPQDARDFPEICV